MERIIAVNSNCYHGYSIEQAISGIQRAGFRHIELTATKGWTEHVFPDQSFERLLAIKEALDHAGLTAIAMSGHCNLMDKARIPDFVKNIDLAAFFGCRYIVSSIGEAHLADRAVMDNEAVAAAISALIPQLARHDLTLVLETHGAEHGTGLAIADIVHRVNDRRVQINYDTANVIYHGHANPVSDLAQCVDDVAYVHLKDKAGAEDEWNFPALGAGTIDFPAILGILDRAGNDSPLSIEIEFTADGPGSVEAVDDAVKESADFLRGLGIDITGGQRP